MEFAPELQASLPEFTASGIVEVRENGGCVAPFPGMSWEVRGHGDKPLLHLWSEQLNLTRRVLAITDHSEQRLALAVERFSRAKPDRLEFIRREFERGARELSREEFCDRRTHLFAEQFPDETLESLAVPLISPSGGASAGIPFANRLSLALPFAGTRGCARRPCRKLAPWLARGHAPVAAREGATSSGERYVFHILISFDTFSAHDC